MSKGNSTLQVQITLNGKYSQLLGKDGLRKVVEERAADFESLIRAALDAGAFKPGNFRLSSNGNPTARTGAISVDLVTCDKPAPKADEEPTKATKAELRKELLSKIL